MAYVHVSTDKKKEIVKSCYSGKKITELSEQFNVSRASIYTWCKEAEDALEHALEERGHRDKLTELEKSNEELRLTLMRLQEAYNNISHKSHEFLPPNEIDEPLLICSECGCSALWKNGAYRKKGYGITKDEGLVQRYICSNCKANIYVFKKNSK